MKSKMKHKVLAGVLVLAILFALLPFFGMQKAEASPDWKQLYFDKMLELLQEHGTFDSYMDPYSVVQRFVLADLNFDGTPELLAEIQTFNPRGYTVFEAYTITRSGVERIPGFDLFGYPDILLYRKITDGSYTYLLSDEWSSYVEGEGRLIATDSTTRFDSDFMATAQTLLSYSLEINDDFIYHVNGLTLSYDEFTAHSGNIISAYEIVDGKPASLYFTNLWGIDPNFDYSLSVEENIRIFLDSYVLESVPENPQPITSGNYSVNHEPFEWLGKTPEEMDRLTGGYIERESSIDFDGTRTAIYKYGNFRYTFSGEEPQGAGGERHPYAIALEEFFNGSGGEKTAWLVDVPGIEEPAVLAQIHIDWHNDKYRFFYMVNGTLYIKDAMDFVINDTRAMWTWDHPFVYPGTIMRFSFSNYLLTSGGDAGDGWTYIHLFTEGEPEPVTISLEISYEYVDSVDDFVFWGAWYNGNEISETEYNDLRRQYGLDQWAERPDDTAKILAMTLTAPDNNSNQIRLTNQFECSLIDIITGIGSYITVDDLDRLFGPQQPHYHGGEFVDGYIYEYGGASVWIMFNGYTSEGHVPANARVAVYLEADRFRPPNQAGQYLLEPPGRDETIVTPDRIRSITDPESANDVISDVIKNMTPEQRRSGNARDNAALFIERAVGRGVCIRKLSFGSIGYDELFELTGTANGIMSNARSALIQEEIALLRKLRLNISLFTDESGSFHFDFPDDVSGIGFDNITIESNFVSVTLPNNSINIGSEIEIRNLEFGEDLNKQTRGFNLIDFWSVGVILLFGIIWSILYIFNHRLRAWVVPAFSVLAISINVATYLLGGGASTIGMGSQRITDTIEVVMSEGMNATISLPATDTEKDSLVLLNADGVPQLSKYNPVTGTIDASINESGVYQLKEFTVDFSDIEQKDMQMREAITQLSSRNIMTGNVEGAFNPDDPITRAEFISAAIRVFDMLDTNAVSSFNDMSRSDWYYAAVATAEQEGLIDGFDDNTFRGNTNIPKDLMVVVTANLLAGQMGYLVPSDIEAELARYLDRDEIERWSENGAALATQSNVLIYRIDGLFAPKTTMTRGDAAVVLYKVFNKVW